MQKGSKNYTFQETIRGILLMKGEEVLTDEKLFLSIFRDVQPKMHREKEFLENLYAINGVEILWKYRRGLSKERRELMDQTERKLSEVSNWSEEETKDLLTQFLKAIGWTIPRSSRQDSQIQEEKKAEQKQVNSQEQKIKKEGAKKNAQESDPVQQSTKKTETSSPVSQKKVTKDAGMTVRTFIRKITSLILIVAAFLSAKDSWDIFMESKMLFVMLIVWLLISVWGIVRRPGKQWIIGKIFFWCMAFTGAILVISSIGTGSIDRSEILVGIFLTLWGYSMAE